MCTLFVSEHFIWIFYFSKEPVDLSICHHLPQGPSTTFYGTQRYIHNALRASEWFLYFSLSTLRAGGTEFSSRRPEKKTTSHSARIKTLRKNTGSDLHMWRQLDGDTRRVIIGNCHTFPDHKRGRHLPGASVSKWHFGVKRALTTKQKADVKTCKSLGGRWSQLCPNAHTTHAHQLGIGKRKRTGLTTLKYIKHSRGFHTDTTIHGTQETAVDR